ncbi:TBC1 domain family member 31 [Malaya genurostris]|uniref:TBC1 domain family member 31 n=1 Tax=Malaya genurostris TaxID=325434 RepID=UPI0026F3DC62|nr:TBC1 domain family member 31 [Malaya genurostris]
MTDAIFDVKQATAIVPMYDGSADSLSSFTDAVSLLAELTPANQLATALKFVKTRLTGKARLGLGNCDTLQALADDVERRCKVRPVGNDKLRTLLYIHHSINNNGFVLRIRFTHVCFSQNNEKLITVDHRGNIFVFDLANEFHWHLKTRVEDITTIECIPENDRLALGNKHGFLYVVDYDSDDEIVRVKAHQTRIASIKFPPWYEKTPLLRQSNQKIISQKTKTVSKSAKPDNANVQLCAYSTKSSLFLVITVDCAMLYDKHNFVELHRLHYGIPSQTKRLYELHWVPRKNMLMSCGIDGTIQLWTYDFQLIKELNVKKLKANYLRQCRAEFIGCQPTEYNLCKGDRSHGEIERLIQSMITDENSNGYVKSVQFIRSGKFLILNCLDNCIIILCCTSWQICKALTLSDLHFGHFEILQTNQHFRHRDNLTILVQTIENDLLLLNLEDGHKAKIDSRLESKCYKFRLSCNDKMLASVLKTGEVLLHNLEFLSRTFYANKFNHSAPRDSSTTSKTHSRIAHASIPASQRQNARDCMTNSNLATSPPSSLYSTPATIASFASMNSAQSVPVFRKESKLKLDKRLEEIRDKMSKTLDRNRLLPILIEFGEYPEKHRTIIWRTLLELPQNSDGFNVLLMKGHHPCVCDYDTNFSDIEPRIVRNVKKIVSCLAHWSPVFAHCDFLPFFVHPFVKIYHNDSLTCFEAVATILLNHCQLWFEFAPLEPFNYLGMIENILCEYEPNLMIFYREHNISSRIYAMTMMEMAFAQNFNANQWRRLWDHVLSNESYFVVFFIVAYNAAHKSSIMKCTSEHEIRALFHEPAMVDIKNILKRTYNTMEKCTDNIHPRCYMKSFRSLNGIAGSDMKTNDLYRQKYSLSSSESIYNSTYSKFNHFPKKLVDIRTNQLNCLKKEQDQLESRILEMEKLERSLQNKVMNVLVQDEHDMRMKEVERKFEDTLATETRRIDMQRKLLLLHKKKIRKLENEALLESKNVQLKHNVATREAELDKLLKTLQRERQQEEIDMLIAEENIKLKQIALQSCHWDSNFQQVNDCSLEQRYFQAIQQLERQKQKLYQDIEKVSDYTSCSLLCENRITNPKQAVGTSNIGYIREIGLEDYSKRMKQISAQLDQLAGVQQNDINL